MISAPLITATLILTAGVIDDLRSRKFHNWLFLTCAGIGFAQAIAIGGVSALNGALIGFLAGIVMLLPLVLMKMIGAGDMKLLAAFGAAAGWEAVVNVGVLSLIWGAIFGLMQVILNGQLKQTLANMVAIASMKERSQLELHKIPYTVALMMAWLTHLVLKGLL